MNDLVRRAKNNVAIIDECLSGIHGDYVTRTRYEDMRDACDRLSDYIDRMRSMMAESKHINERYATVADVESYLADYGDEYVEAFRDFGYDDMALTMLHRGEYPEEIADKLAELIEDKL